MNILVTGAWNCTKEQFDRIADAGHSVVFLQNEKDPLPVAPAWVEAVICNGLFVHHPVELFESLRFIQVTSAGYDRLPMEYIQDKGIALYNARGVYSIPMAEFALGGVLQLYKQSRFFLEKQQQNCWQKHRGLLELYGKTVCIIGCGSVGGECAKRFAAFGCKIIGVARRERKNAYFDRIVSASRLDEVLPEADIVVLSLPLTEESRHLINRKRLASMKKGAVLVNLARGAVVDTEALLWWLETGQGAAILDVFEEEPLSVDSPLWQMSNVILTPHNSFVGEGNGERLTAVIMSNLGIG